MSVKRFKRLLAIREVQENEAATVLAARLDELRRTEEQRDQLQEYQRLYWGSAIPSDARLLKQMAQIQQELRAAIEQQEQRITAAQSRVEQARSVWLERHQASLSLEKLIERRRRLEMILDNRKQQREQDMWATRRAFQQQKDATE